MRSGGICRIMKAVFIIRKNGRCNAAQGIAEENTVLYWKGIFSLIR